MVIHPAQFDTLLIYGGSFDPPHRAHVELPLQAARHFSAALLYVPAGDPPHKSRLVTPAAHRLAMLQLALEDHANASICDLELRRPGKSYTVDTLEELRRLYPRQTLRLLIGADMAAIFYQWRQPRRILQLAEPVVMMRSPYEPADLLRTLPADLPPEERDAWARRIVAVDRLDISSTELRDLLRAGEYRDPRLIAMLDPRVLDYIIAHDLYRHAP